MTDPIGCRRARTERLILRAKSRHRLGIELLRSIELVAL